LQELWPESTPIVGAVGYSHSTSTFDFFAQVRHDFNVEKNPDRSTKYLVNHLDFSLRQWASWGFASATSGARPVRLTLLFGSFAFNIANTMNGGRGMQS
jgi:hypothetical protein